MVRQFYILIFLLASCNFTFSQSNIILDSFTAFKNNNEVHLNWTLKSGSTCNGIQILRSTDGNLFFEIGYIDGVCGSTSSPTTYDFIDTSPLNNSINYYRLALGGNGTSITISLDIFSVSNAGYKVLPNPVSSTAKIYFSNDNYQYHNITLYNSNGLFISTFTSKMDFFELNAANFKNGIYFFAISDSESTVKVTGKLLIQR